MFDMGQCSGFPAQISTHAVRQSCVFFVPSMYRTPAHERFYWALHNPGLNTQNFRPSDVIESAFPCSMCFISHIFQQLSNEDTLPCVIHNSVSVVADWEPELFPNSSVTVFV